ncbi:MAG: hypothetical protein AMJ65_14615 [Phycisphaerae bacterium SG8_4]|nr:MAG: hypothetical protein AMJ65_14615 [Phycisphaerae bacterium SG8_4]
MKSTRRRVRYSSFPRVTSALATLLLLATASAQGQQLQLDERHAQPGEWGYRPANGAVSRVNPPAFSWRPQGSVTWEIECGRGNAFDKIEYRAKDLEFNVHCPAQTFTPGMYSWRYRGMDKNGRYTRWSKPRTFTIAADAAALPLPARAELIARIPKSHPRLFMRPENLDRLRESARGKMKAEYNELVKDCQRLLSRPPATKEPPTYPEGIVRGSDPWRDIWWGNRTYTIRALNAAATLAFTRLLGGQEEYGLEAKRILLECAKWDPKGSTGYRYNDEAGMPYNYYFSRTYSFVNDLLNEEQKELCRKVMKIRGDEMYRHLCPGHLWRPYGSHANRAWHFLGEIGVAFLGEVEGAEDWVWFATNVFFNVYPVWCDDDGGWHEGSSYWSSYQGRFTWWADVMREAMGIDAYDKPFYSKAGYYAMYLLPPGKVGGGFGDLTARRTARSNVPLVSSFAAQAQNGHWQWYVEQLGGPANADGYIGFIRGQLPDVTAVPPDEMPTSRLFAGTGQAYLNTNLTDAGNSVQVVFKSSPFGTQSHGYEANNSFLLWAYGKRLLIRSGYRDSYGSDHHKNWMWSTRSVNNITVNGEGQGRRTAKAQGKIVAFKTTPEIDIVIGEAGQAYETPLERFTRAIIFVKPELIIVYDRLEATEPSVYEYWLHALNKIGVQGQHEVQVRNGDVLCDIDFLAPEGLSFKQTDQYDPNPRPRIKLREWHLTATTPQKSKQMEFVTLYRPHRAGDEVDGAGTLRSVAGGYVLTAGASGNKLTALLPTDEAKTLETDGMTTRGAVAVRLEHPDGRPAQIVEVREGDLK